MRAWTQGCLLTCVCFSEKDHRGQSVLTAPPRHVLALNGPELKGRDVGSVLHLRACDRGLCALSLLRMQSYREKKKKSKLG